TLSGGSADIPAMVVTMSSDLSPSELDAGFERAARSDIENIPGVARVQLFGTTEESVRINPDDDALAERDMDRSTITAALDDADAIFAGQHGIYNDEILDLSMGKAFVNVDAMAASLVAV